MSVYQVLLTAHGMCGMAALVGFWIAGLSKKGSPTHRSAGKIYLLAMIGIIVTAAPMAAIIARTGRYGIAIFLAYLIVIVATSMWSGWSAVRNKRDQARYRRPLYLTVAMFNLLAAGAVLVAGWRMAQPLLMGFSLVGVATGAQMLIRRARPLAESRWWLREHIGAMIGGGVAVHIAFLAIGLNRLVNGPGVASSNASQMIAWFGPVLVGVVANIWTTRKYLSTGRSATTRAREAPQA